MATCSTLLPGGTAEAPLQVVFFLQTLILCLVTTSIWESFRVVFSDNGWRCSWLVKNASSSRAQWTLCSGKVKSQGIKKLQVVVVEFWTLEPTMSSAIITMGRSPTACPFGRTSLSNKISSWFFFIISIAGTATTCTYQVTTHFQTTWNNPGSLVTTRCCQGYFNQCRGKSLKPLKRSTLAQSETHGNTKQIRIQTQYKS